MPCRLHERTIYDSFRHLILSPVGEKSGNSLLTKVRPMPKPALKTTAPRTRRADSQALTAQQGTVKSIFD